MECLENFKDSEYVVQMVDYTEVEKDMIILMKEINGFTLLELYNIIHFEI